MQTNYCMFRYMFPQPGEYFKYTDSNQSAGIRGMSINEIEHFKKGELLIMKKLEIMKNLNRTVHKAGFRIKNTVRKS